MIKLDKYAIKRKVLIIILSIICVIYFSISASFVYRTYEASLLQWDNTRYIYYLNIFLAVIYSIIMIFTISTFFFGNALKNMGPTGIATMFMNFVLGMVAIFAMGWNMYVFSDASSGGLNKLQYDMAIFSGIFLFLSTCFLSYYIYSSQKGYTNMPHATKKPYRMDKEMPVVQEDTDSDILTPSKLVGKRSFFGKKKQFEKPMISDVESDVDM